jgi:hypothetical protein
VKLDRSLSVVAVLAGVLATGCSTTPRPTPVYVPADAVSTVRLMAAEIRSTDDAPKVGKSQHSDATFDEDDAAKKDAPQRRGERKPGGGFSGYK